MSLAINERALDRVCKKLEIGRQLNDIVITPEQKSPLACCSVDYENANMITIYMNDELDCRDANWIILHELYHAHREIHHQVTSSGKYQADAEAAGFDPRRIMAMQRDELTDEELERYQQLPEEKAADEFARQHDDLYEVIVEK